MLTIQGTWIGVSADWFLTCRHRHVPEARGWTAVGRIGWRLRGRGAVWRRRVNFRAGHSWLRGFMLKSLARMNRTAAIAIVGLWLVAMVSLLVRDVLPYWEKQNPPSVKAPVGNSQIGIYRGDQQIGTSWVTIRHTAELDTWTSSTELALPSGMLPGFPGLPPVLIDTVLSFSPNQELTSFETRIEGMPEPIEVEGNLLGIDYSCVARIGRLHHGFSLDARFSRSLGESLRPFTHLSNLYVGQQWQMRVLDPLSLIMGQSPRFAPMLVRVVGKETIDAGGKRVECHQVVTDNGRAQAFVRADGTVLLQTVQLPPPIGKLTLRDEPFSDLARREVRRRYSRTTRSDSTSTVEPQPNVDSD